MIHAYRLHPVRVFIIACAILTSISGSAPTEAATRRADRLPTLGRLAYILDADVWVRDLPSGNPQRLTTEGGYHTPRWSPSGEWLAVKRDKALWLLRRTGTDALQVNRSQPTWHFAWSPTADILAYQVEEGELRLIAPPKMVETQVRPNRVPEGMQTGSHFAWSPNGETLAFVTYVLQGPDSHGGFGSHETLSRTDRAGRRIVKVMQADNRSIRRAGLRTGAISSSGGVRSSRFPSWRMG